MNVRSLDLRTDLMFARFEGEVLDRGHYVVVRTPSNPTFRWGNYLMFQHGPVPGDEERWPALFQLEMADLPPVLAHRAFVWDDSSTQTADLSAFVAAGYRVECSTILTADRCEPPPRPNGDALCRPLRTDDDWAQATENQIRCLESDEDEAGFRAFKERQMSSYRRMTEAGLGHWFGAFEVGRLRADLGLFVESGIGRFQQVCTDPRHRRRGLCGTLLHAAARLGFESMGARSLVIVAEEGGAPARIYGSVGFQRAAGRLQIERKVLA